ncbi:MFS transporter [Azorhizobium oxalatiphilum]|uniref:MFS-type drug efflux transporter P55 n=1 Tax=Azorhizobium oxalatiphilum TaxID=980631 RepID=A0A917FDV7_9HYPH|nr:MDR family MFS transporter [Azorhizobium oxalatiphilum]GGF66013.1 MFS transporter [Azorhizobium oxalatiphilum]
MSVHATPRQRAYLVCAILMSTFMVAVESTIVATAMPSIVGRFGGFDHYSWVFSSFLLAQTSTTVIYGKLADIFGRKPVLIAGIALFLVGSLLCGLAWSMTALVAFRLLQGIGAGAIQPITITLVGDLYRLEERGKVQGLVATVWAASAVVGPLVGGVLVDYVSWVWVFWMNLPIGLFAMAGFWLFLREQVEPRQSPIDYLGAALLSVAIGALLILISETDGSAGQIGLAGAVFLLSSLAFVWQERRAREPIVSFALWRRKLLAACNLTALLAGVLLIGLTALLPLHVQGVLGRSPIVAGLALTMLTLGWPLAVALSPRLFRAFGVRNALRYVSLMLPIGAGLMLLLGPGASPVLAGFASFLVGIGMGIASFTCIVLIQESVEWSMRGSATASNIFARSLGCVLGATVAGAILNIGLARYAAPDVAERLHAVLNQPAGLAGLAADPAAVLVFDQALHLAFTGLFVVALITAAATWFIPADLSARGRPAEASPALGE